MVEISSCTWRRLHFVLDTHQEGDCSVYGASGTGNYHKRTEDEWKANKHLLNEFRIASHMLIVKELQSNRGTGGIAARIYSATMSVTNIRTKQR
jgi:hypothetical protein